jgi:hypothetical protein
MLLRRSSRFGANQIDRAQNLGTEVSKLSTGVEEHISGIYARLNLLAVHDLFVSVPPVVLEEVDFPKAQIRIRGSDAGPTVSRGGHYADRCEVVPEALTEVLNLSGVADSVYADRSGSWLRSASTAR